MPHQVIIDYDDDLLINVGLSPEEFAVEARLLLAAQLYEQGKRSGSDRRSPRRPFPPSGQNAGPDLGGRSRVDRHPPSGCLPSSGQSGHGLGADRLPVVVGERRLATGEPLEQGGL